MVSFISNVIRNVIIIFVCIIALIVFIVYRNKAKRKNAARRAAEARQREHEQARLEAEEADARSHLAYQKRQQETEEAIDQNPSSRQYRLETMQTESSAKMLNITTFTPISKKRYIAFDLETTGLSAGGDAIVEIGAVLVEDGVITREFSQLIDPERPMPEESSAVNHITDDMLKGKPKIHQVLPAFLAFVGDDALAAHNAGFDARFLCQACMRNRFRIPLAFFDTMSLARYWPEAENKKLTTLAAAAGITVDDAHRAISDARTVAELITATNKRRSEKKAKG